MALTKQERRYRIKKRIRKIVSGTAERPRLNVFRSNKQIYAPQRCLKRTMEVSSLNKDFVGAEGTKTEIALKIGKAIAEKAIASGITTVVFDRNGYLYHGRVKQLADAAREGGLKF